MYGRRAVCARLPYISLQNNVNFKLLELTKRYIFANFGLANLFMVPIFI